VYLRLYQQHGDIFGNLGKQKTQCAFTRCNAAIHIEGKVVAISRQTISVKAEFKNDTGGLIAEASAQPHHRGDSSWYPMTRDPCLVFGAKNTFQKLND
jgi:hypothetical protein